MKLIAILLVPFAVACTATTESESGPRASRRDAGRALGAATAVLENLDTKAGARGVLATVSFSEPCETSGSINVDGSFDSNQQTSKFDVDVEFAQCAIEGDLLDGTVHWTEEADGDSYTSKLTGTLAWTGVDATASCTFDLTMESTPSGITYSGTVCGYDAAELNAE